MLQNQVSNINQPRKEDPVRSLKRTLKARIIVVASLSLFLLS